MRRHLVVLLALLLGTPAFAGGRDLGPRPPGAFDYYVLSLSWVPAFCATHADPAECSTGLGFALHGLWPQDEGGGYPSFCSRAALSVPDRARFQDLYASPKLIGHEWERHGTCSGLSPAGYFGLARSDLAEVTIPAAYRRPRVLSAGEARAVELAFVAANRALPPGAVRAVVARGQVSEVEICLSKTGGFRAC